MLVVRKSTLCMLLCMLEAVERGLCLPEVFELLEVMCCVLLCMPEAVEGRLSFEVSLAGFSLQSANG